MKNNRIFLFAASLLLVSNLARGQSWCHVFITDTSEVTCIRTLNKDELFLDNSQLLYACEHSTNLYTATYSLQGEDTLVSLTWTVTGADSYTPNPDNTVTVHWGAQGRGMVIVDIETSSGTTCSAVAEVELVESPVIGITTVPAYVVENGMKIIRVCKGSTVYFNDASTCSGSNIAGYYWSSDQGVASTANFTIDNVVQSQQVYHRVYNNCGCYDVDSIKVEVIAGEPLELSCYGTVCEGATVTYKALNYSCSPFYWYVEGGQIIDGQGTPDVTVLWGSPDCGYGILGLDGSSCQGNICPSMMSVKIPIITNNVAIVGDTMVCPDEPYIYTAPIFGSTEYTWTITPHSNVTEMMVNGANKIKYMFSTPGDYTLSVSYYCDFLDCGRFASQTLNIHVKPRLEIRGNKKLCLSSVSNLVLNDTSAIAYWQVYDASTDALVFDTTGKILNHRFASSGRYRITATCSDFCNVATFLLNVFDPPAAPVITDFLHADTLYTCPIGFVQLQGQASDPRYDFIWEVDCDSVSPRESDGDTTVIYYNGTICDVSVFYYDKTTRCRSDSAYIQTVRELTMDSINLPDTVRVCPGTEVNFTNAQVPYQAGVQYRWYIEETKQHYITIVDTQFSNEVSLRVLYQVSGVYDNFYMVLERKFCESTQYDTVHFTFNALDTILHYIDPDTVRVCLNTCAFVRLHTPEDNDAVLWTWDDGKSTHGNPQCHFYSRPGTYMVQSRYNFGYDFCTNSDYWQRDTAIVIVNPMPSYDGLVHFANGTLRLSPNVVPTPPGYTFSWTLDGNPIAGNGPSITTTQPGNYVCVVTNQYGCSKSYSWRQRSGYGGHLCDTMVIRSVHPTDLCDGMIFLQTPTNVVDVNWTIPVSEKIQHHIISSNPSTIMIVFDTVGTFIIYAHGVDREGNCYESSYTVRICSLLDFELERSCDGAIVHNHSQYLNDGIVNCTVYHNGVVVNSQNSFNMHDTIHEITFTHSQGEEYVVVFSFDNGCGQICEVSRTIKYLKIRNDFHINTSNNLMPNNACTNVPLSLWLTHPDYPDISEVIQYVYWNYGDNSCEIIYGDSTEHTFASGGNDSTYAVIATIIDSNGCEHKVETKIKSHDNDLRGHLDIITPLVCIGNERKVAYTPVPLNPSRYDWIPPMVQSTLDNQAYTLYPVNCELIVTSRYFCRNNYSIQVPFKPASHASIYTPKHEYCKGENVELYGGSGLGDPSLTYTWTIRKRHGSPAYTATLTGPEVVFIPPYADDYDIVLNVSRDGCPATDTTEINVHSLPVAPIIEFDGNSCCISDPPVKLHTANNSAANIVYWSNGVYAHNADYYTSGMATAYYYDNVTGCPSNKAEIFITPEPNFDGLLTGCYEKCEEFFTDSLPAYAITEGGYSIGWEWHYSGSNIPWRDSGNYLYQPIMLPLTGYGDYVLSVMYDNSPCYKKSPTLTIEPTKACDCDSLVMQDVYGYVKIDGCKLYVCDTIIICNESQHNACLHRVDITLPSNYATIQSSNLPIMIPAGRCEKLIVCFVVTDPSLSHIPLQIFDECNNCYSNISVPLDLDIKPCEEVWNSDGYDLLPDLSDAYTAFFKFYFSYPGNATLLSIWSEPPQVWDYYPAPGNVSALTMFDVGALSQMAENGEKVCFHAIFCVEENLLCEQVWCCSAEEILARLREQYPFGAKQTDGNSINRSLDDSLPYLQPNPAQHSFTVMGIDKVTEMTLIDMQGRKLATVDNSNTMNVHRVAKGSYIVRVVEKGVRVYYLKLIKQ